MNLTGMTMTLTMRKLLFGAVLGLLLLTLLCACDRQDPPPINETTATTAESETAAATADGTDTETAAPTDGETDDTETATDTPQDRPEESAAESADEDTAEGGTIELPKVEFD